MRKPALSSILCVLSTLTACGDDPPPPSDVRARITNDLGNVLREAAAASESGSTAMSGGSFGTAMIDRLFGASGTTVLPRVRTTVAGLVGSHGDRLSTGDRSPSDTTGTGFDVDALTEELNTKLFTDANYLGDGVYRVPAELVCKTTTVDTNGTTTEGVDADCAAKLDTAQLRVRTATDGGTLELAIQVDANHDEPLAFALSHTALAVTLDLDQAGRAITALAPLFGETIPNTSLAGAVSGRIDILGTANAKFSLSIDRALAIKAADAGIDLDGAQATRFTSAKANVAEVSIDGARKAGSIVIGLGATTAHVPGDQVYDLDLPGATMVAMFIDGLPLTLTHVGLGDRATTVSIDGNRAIAIDLNPQDGRAFGATIAADRATGLTTLTPTPRLDLRYTIDHAALGDQRPVYDVTQVLLDGSIRGGDASDRVEVLSGTFGLVTNPASFGFSATAGQCVSPQEVEDATTGALYDQWTVGACN